MKSNNPNLVEIGKPTQFACGNNAQKDRNAKPWSFRNELRYLMKQEIDYQDLEGERKRFLRPPPSGALSIHRILAVQLVWRVIYQMEPRLLNFLINKSEGKFAACPAIEKKSGPMPEFTLAEATAAYNQLMKSSNALAHPK